MELTPRETKILSQMRKQQAQWPKVRWLQLLIGIGMVIAFASQFHRLADLLKYEPTLGVVTFAATAPMVILWITLGAYRAGQAIVEWHGNPVRTLLLKVIDDIEKREKADSEQRRP